MSRQRAANNTNIVANAMMDPAFSRLRNHQVGYYNDAHVAPSAEPDRTLPHLKYNYVMGDVSACGGGGGGGGRWAGSTWTRERAEPRNHFLAHRRGVQGCGPAAVAEAHCLFSTLRRRGNTAVSETQQRRTAP